MARVDALEQRKCRPVTDSAQTPRLFYVSVGVWPTGWLDAKLLSDSEFVPARHI